MSLAEGILEWPRPGGVVKPLDDEPPELGTVYVETVTRVREVMEDDRTGGGGVRGVNASSLSASAKGSSSLGMTGGSETTGAGTMEDLSADAVRSAGTGGGGGARLVGVGEPYVTDVRRGRLPEADTERGTPTRVPAPAEPLDEAPIAKAVREVGAMGGDGPSYRRTRGAQTLGMRFQEASILELEKKCEGAPNAPWTGWIRRVETDMAWW